MLFGTLSITKEATHRGWCVSIEWPIGWVSLIQVICWGMKLSAFYTRCERACNSCPSAQALGQECVASLCEFQLVETPVLLVSFLVNLQVWTCLFKETLLSLSKKCFCFLLFSHKKECDILSLFGSTSCVSVFWCYFSFLNLFTTDNMLKNPTSGLNKYDDWKLLSFVV